MQETYLPAFQACVREGQAASVMCSYNAVNGVPACANADLLQTTLRDQWGFQGFVVSDCGAVQATWWPHKLTKYVNYTLCRLPLPPSPPCQPYNRIPLPSMKPS